MKRGILIIALFFSVAAIGAYAEGADAESGKRGPINAGTLTIMVPVSNPNNPSDNRVEEIVIAIPPELMEVYAAGDAISYGELKEELTARVGQEKIGALLREMVYMPLADKLDPELKSEQKKIEYDKRTKEIVINRLNIFAVPDEGALGGETSADEAEEREELLETDVDEIDVI
jgi:hypothetical protein